MNEKELKKEFEFYCSNGLVKYDNKWDFYWDVLDINENTKNIFKSKIKLLLEKLNNGDENLINMETDDIYNILKKI